MTEHLFKSGHKIIGKYIVDRHLGDGWEGQVYLLREDATGIERAAKFFYPDRNLRDRTLRTNARKLDRLRHCPVLIRYHTHERMRYRGESLSFLVSEFVDGEVLSQFVKRYRGNRMPSFDAMHLLHTLAQGIERIHEAGEYHGDLHWENVLVTRRGIYFDVKMIDLMHTGRRTREHVQDDICDLIRLFHFAIGGRRHYAAQPNEAKTIMRGLRRDLICKRFRTVTALRRHLEQFDWGTD